jgi:outer membrane protein assembly factor BamB
MFANTGIEDEYFKDYSKGVTRVEAAYHLVHSYYALIGKPLDIEGAAPFADTDCLFAAKARELGLMNGTNAELNLFTPGTILTREQTAAMLINLLDKAGVNYDKSSVSHIRFADQNQIADWAETHVRRVFHLGLINGTSTANPPHVNPKGVLDRQQLYQMLWNLFVSLNKIEDGFARGKVIGQPQLVHTGIGRASSSYVDEAYYAAPVVVDIDGCGRMEVIFTSYTTFCADLLTGEIKWQAPSGYDRRAPAGTKALGESFADPIVMDVDGNGQLDIIVGHKVRINPTTGAALSASQHTGVLAVYDRNGNFKPGWPVRLPRAINSVSAAIVDGKARIVVGLIGSTGLDTVQMFDHAGNRLWSQLDNNTWAHRNPDRAANTGYTYGLQNNTIAFGDINGSGVPSIIVPTDCEHIAAFDLRGNLIKANPIFTHQQTGVPRSWGRIGIWLDYEYEKQVINEGFPSNSVWTPAGSVKVPWEEMPMSNRLFANFMHSPAVIADVDGDGINEIIVIGRITDAAFLYPDPPVFEAPFIFNGDRTRFKTDKFDWETVPTNAGPIHNFEYREMLLSQAKPVVADVNADGVNEIIFNSHSGKVLCYSLDKQFMWSHWINDKDEFTVEVASPPVAYDLNGNGFQNIIFATSTPFDSKRTGRLIILDFNGTKITEVELPKSIGSSDKTNGVVAAPVVTEVNGEIYIVLNTYLSGLTIYKMP